MRIGRFRGAGRRCLVITASFSRSIIRRVGILKSKSLGMGPRWCILGRGSVVSRGAIRKSFPHYLENYIRSGGANELKVIEECPSPFVQTRPGMRAKLTKCATAYAQQLKYKSAGTVEFLVDDTTGDFFFLEMNTRLQVEHGITELCYAVDLVALMLQQADCEKGGKSGIPSEDLLLLQKDGPTGAAIEVRVYAEVPYRGYAPSPGLLQAVAWPVGEGVRVDTWVRTGQRIASFYGDFAARGVVES